MFNVVVEVKAPEIIEAIWALIGKLANTKINGEPAQIPTIIPTVQQAQQAPVQQVEIQQQPVVQVTHPEQQYATLGSAQPLQQQPQQPTQAQQPIPMQQVQPQQQPQPMQQQQAPTAVPTTAPTYTVEQLAVAATQLVDAGRRTELVTLLSAFGVQALTALPKEQYGNFATQLRAMGAKI